jgi:hypothetical protein
LGREGREGEVREGEVRGAEILTSCFNGKPFLVSFPQKNSFR